MQEVTELLFRIMTTD